MKRTKIAVFFSLLASMLILLACGGPPKDKVAGIISDPGPEGIDSVSLGEAEDLAEAIANDPTGTLAIGVESTAGTNVSVEGQTGPELVETIATGQSFGAGRPVERVELTQTEDDERYVATVEFEDGTTGTYDIVMENGEPKLVVPITGN